ncbi:MAG: hypothetical protein ACOYEV_19615, partial [Candidatus Nanopelagicales bacterium]
MVAAGVVVANPILVPRADLQIPAVSLSAGTADSMLDKSFLDAIAPAAPESNGPFSVLKQLVSALAADATYLGKNAIVDAFVAGVGAVSGPDLGAVNNTYVAPSAPPAALVVSPPPDLSTQVPALVPHVDVSVLSAANIPTDIVNATSAYVDASVVPAVEQVLSAIAYDATYIGKNVLTAAYAVGAAVAAEPGLIGETLTALVNGDIKAALENAVKAVVKVVETPFTSSLQVINAIKNVIETHLKELVAIFTPAAPVDVPATPAPSAGDGTDLPSVPAPSGRRPRVGDIPILASSRVTAPRASA